jgi:hypothetical protein
MMRNRVPVLSASDLAMAPGAGPAFASDGVAPTRTGTDSDSTTQTASSATVGGAAGNANTTARSVGAERWQSGSNASSTSHNGSASTSVHQADLFTPVRIFVTVRATSTTGSNASTVEQAARKHEEARERRKTRMSNRRVLWA